MKILIWLLRAFLFFVLFAFAMNNEHEAQLKWFFGYEWRAPMVFVVLVVFALGCLVAVFGLLPTWWRLRRRIGALEAQLDVIISPPSSEAARRAPTRTAAAMPELEHPPRDGL
jgi:lipopolysaccharide assembly protein A